VADLDGNGFFHHPLPPLLARALPRIEGALAGMFDPFVGRKLYTWLRRAGLRDVTVQLLPYNLHAGRADGAALANWTLKLDTIAPRCREALGGRAPYERFKAAFLGHLRQPDSLSYSVLFIVAGIKPRGRRARR
jgi:hypothetical protein